MIWIGSFIGWELSGWSNHTQTLSLDDTAPHCSLSLGTADSQQIAHLHLLSMFSIAGSCVVVVVRWSVQQMDLCQAYPHAVDLFVQQSFAQEQHWSWAQQPFHDFLPNDLKALAPATWQLQIRDFKTRKACNLVGVLEACTRPLKAFNHGKWIHPTFPRQFGRMV